MINWLHMEDGYCEGCFKAVFFRDDENGDELTVMAKSPELRAGAEKCVEALNGLTDSQIDEICKSIINHLKENGMDEEFDLSQLDDFRGILNCCWFTTLYVNMLSEEDETDYVLEGEGDWGDVIGIVVNNGKLIYVGNDYFEYMKEE